MTVLHSAIVFSTALAFILLAIARLSFAYGRTRSKKSTTIHKVETGTTNIQAAVFGLLGLMLAFTFSGAYSRLEVRRALVASEANALTTAFLRIDLVPEESKISLKKKFIEYADSKHKIWTSLPDVEKAMLEYSRSLEIQKRIWQEAVDATKAPESMSVRILVLPPINEFIDRSMDRLVAMQNHAPWVVYALIFCLAIACAFFVGLSQSICERFQWAHMIVFTLMISATIYLILDLEYPSVGLINLDTANAVFSEIKNDFLKDL